MADSAMSDAHFAQFVFSSVYLDSGKNPVTFQEQIQEQPAFLRPAGVDFGTAVRKVKGVPVGVALIGVFLIQFP